MNDLFKKNRTTQNDGENVQKEKKQNNGMLKIASFIVDRRNLFYLLFILAVVFSLVGSRFVNVENDITKYLPQDSETNVGLNLMEQEFITYGTAKVMISNVTYKEADKLAEKLNALDYVQLVQFDDSKAHYNDFSALYSITFPYDEKDERCLELLNRLKGELTEYDYNVSTEMGDQTSEALAKEVSKIIVFVAIIVVVVLLFTSTSYAEVPVLIATFLVSAALAKGSNFLLGKISFVSNSVAIVLQLALSVDYAVIFLNRYKDEHQNLGAREADIVALSKAIPEISASSLTTIGGLVAMAFMQFGIGPDLAIVLIKAIFLSLITVFGLMPGLIMSASELMDRTKHKNFVPQISFVGKFAYATRFIMPMIFLVLLCAGFYYSNHCPYAYGDTLIDTPVHNDKQMIDKMMDDTFGSDNIVAMVFPAGDYEKEAKLIRRLEGCNEVKSITGLANTIAMEDTTLTQKLNAREFGELLDIDTDMAKILYTAYAVNDENYAHILNGIDTYSVCFIDIFQFLYQEVQEGYVTLDEDQNKTLNDANDAIHVAKNQLQGENYSRILVSLNLPEEGKETFRFLDTMHEIGRNFYGQDADILIIGNATSDYDLSKIFTRDNMVVNIVSAMAVLVVLLFTFKSAGMPVLLIVVIEGCIWINFAFPKMTNNYLFFLSYLVVSSIQMGANIDYAIVVSSRYQEMKKSMSQKEAIIDTMNFAFPTIITSGTMLATAGILIGQMTSMAAICGVGQCLGRGTIISIIAVLFVLPQILLVGDRLIDRTSFEVSVPMPAPAQKLNGVTRVDGFINGQVSGVLVGTFHGVVYGEINAQIVVGKQAGEQKNIEPAALMEKNEEKGDDAYKKDC